MEEVCDSVYCSGWEQRTWGLWWLIAHVSLFAWHRAARCWLQGIVRVPLKWIYIGFRRLKRRSALPVRWSLLADQLRPWAEQNKKDEERAISLSSEACHFLSWVWELLTPRPPDLRKLRLTATWFQGFQSGIQCNPDFADSPFCRWHKGNSSPLYMCVLISMINLHIPLCVLFIQLPVSLKNSY